jgi:hypothetical protein
VRCNAGGSTALNESMLGAAFAVMSSPSNESATAAISGDGTRHRVMRSKWLLTPAAISSRVVPMASIGVGDQTCSKVCPLTELSPNLGAKTVPRRSTNQCSVDNGSCQCPAREGCCRKQEACARVPLPFAFLAENPLFRSSRINRLCVGFRYWLTLAENVCTFLQGVNRPRSDTPLRIR